jgi:magnesium transporter
MAGAGSAGAVQDLAWIHIPDADSHELDEIARQQGFHELDVEDCRHHRQIAKHTEYESYTFIVAKLLHFNAERLTLRFEDFNLFIQPHQLVTVPEGKTDVPEKAAQRLSGRPRPVSVARLVHAVLDVIVDDYLPALYRLGEEIDRIEQEVLHEPSRWSLKRIFHLRRQLLEFRRNAISMRDLLGHFLRIHQEAEESLYVYYRDIYDHLLRTIDLTETYRDLLTGALDVYLSAVANRTNDVMKILTIYGTVAIPLVVITGFYGMNIRLPGAQSPHALWLVVGIMGASTAGVLWYFRRKRWW